jgi:hypothetical protein
MKFARRRQHRQAQQAGGLVAECVHRVDDGGEIVEQWAQARQQPLAGRRRRHAARRPVKETHAKAVLEPAHGFAQPRAGDAELERGLGKAAAFRNRNEGIHLGQVRPAHWSFIPNNPCA